MARSGDPRVVVRMSAVEFAGLDALAAACGVSTAGLIREAALRAAPDVARLVERGEIVLRGRNGVRRPASPVSVAGRAAGEAEVAARRVKEARLAAARSALLDGERRAALFRGATQR